jgi:hypothetical protein
MFGSPEEGRLVANLMEAFDKGDHYFRTYLKPPPHNLYTSGDRAERLRTEQILAPIDYAVDPPHDDVELGQGNDRVREPERLAVDRLGRELGQGLVMDEDDF